MACPDREQLSLFIEDQAAPEVARHVAQCLTCQAAAEQLRSLRDAELYGLVRASVVVQRQTLGDAADAAIIALAHQGPPPAGLPRMPEGYELLERIGELSGMGEVYRGRQVALGRDVAVKLIRGPFGDEELRRFEREARATASLRNPHVVTVHELDHTPDGRPFLAMELLRGPTVSALLHGKGALPVGAACEIGRQAALGLKAIHDRGLVHRDIKPGNLMFDENGSLKVLDLGLVLSNGSDGRAGLTRTGTGMGTPHYAAPEQSRDAKTADARADLYSLGCVLFRLLTGTHPFADGSTDYVDIVTAHRRDSRPDVRQWRPEVEEGLARLLLSQLAIEREQRQPGTAAGLADALRHWADRASLASLLQRGVSTPIVPAAPPTTIPAGPKAAPQGAASGIVELVNTVGMRFALVPPGTFFMGSPMDEENRFDDEQQHEVEITKAFYLGVHAVTQKQFRVIMGYNPSYFSTDGAGNERLTYLDLQKPAGGKAKVAGMDTSAFPVENVSWEEAAEFCRRLTEKERDQGTLSFGQEYRLPTEAQWECSCRGWAVTSRPFQSGDSLSSNVANFDCGRPSSEGKWTSPLGRTAKVGSYMPNQLGLYDLHGNVWEWCQDWYDKGFYTRSPKADPTGPQNGLRRVIRGGSWYDYARYCRSAYRLSGEPAYRGFGLGFRVALVSSGE